MSKIIAFLRRDLLVETSYRISFLFQLAGILITIAMFYFVAQLLGPSVAPALAPYGGDYFAFVLIGLAFSGYFSIGLTGFISGLREAQTTGTLEAMLMTPTSSRLIILCSSLWEYVMTTVRVLLFLALGVVIGGMNLGHANVVGALVALVLSIITFSALGILAASFVLVIKRGDPITWVFSSAFMLLGGVYYPVTVMPEYLQQIAGWLPVTFALHALRLALLQGAAFQELLPDLLTLFLFSLILLPLSLFAFEIALVIAKREASLTQY